MSETEPDTTYDKEFFEDFRSYVLNVDGTGGNDGLHNPIPNIIWWAWNDNSGDTGGLVDSTWRNIEWRKIRYLRTLGLKPWYSTSTVPWPPKSPSPPPPVPLPPSPMPPPREGQHPFQSPPSVREPCTATFTVSRCSVSQKTQTCDIGISIQLQKSQSISAPWYFTMDNPGYAGKVDKASSYNVEVRVRCWV
jgi:hypothetical protein